MGSGPVGDIENHQAEQGEPWPPQNPLSAGANVPDSPRSHVIGPDLRFRPLGAL